jgi:hypothetical protein
MAWVDRGEERQLIQALITTELVDTCATVREKTVVSNCNTRAQGNVLLQRPCQPFMQSPKLLFLGSLGQILRFSETSRRATRGTLTSRIRE